MHLTRRMVKDIEWADSDDHIIANTKMGHFLDPLWRAISDSNPVDIFNQGGYFKQLHDKSVFCRMIVIIASLQVSWFMTWVAYLCSIGMSPQSATWVNIDETAIPYHVGGRAGMRPAACLK